MGLRREGIMMNSVDAGDYYKPALHHILYINPETKHLRGTTVVDFDQAVDAFDELLGVTMGNDYYTRPADKDRPMPDDWREFLKTLTSPYGYAILKAYRVKNGLEKVNEPAT